ncbi:unnamed protein product, partial [Prorocentrum cordatum]
TLPPVHLEKSTCLRRAQNNQLGRCPPRLARERARAPRAPARAEAMPRPPGGGGTGAGGEGGGRGRHGERGAGRAARRGGKKMRLPIGWQGCSEDHAPVALYTNYCGTAAPVAHGGHGHRQVFGSPVPHDAGSLGQGMLPGQYCPAEQNVGLHAGPGGYCDGTCTTGGQAFSGVSKPWTRDGTCSAEAQSCSSSVSAATAAPAAAWVAQAKASSARARRAGAILGMVEARAGREWLARVGPW